MAAYCAVLLSAFVVVVTGVLVSYAQGQTTTSQTPPNCVCPIMNTSNSGWSQMQSNSGPSGSSQMQWGGQAGHGGMGSWGGRAKMDTICGSDGQNYTDKCAFVNAQYSNPNLGKLPCKIRQMMNNQNNLDGMNNNMNGMSNNNNNNMMLNPNMNGNMNMMEHGGGSHEQKQKTLCLTSGQSVTGTMHTIHQQLQASTGVGIRCDRPCPCPPIVCPKMRQRKW
ncbi:hypothetical protein RvY_07879 [Ramazzottius varieornatus]|uniref:Kazal-like domain-containing protein n=1 Tax=Ramazzottius varieornatus TaxID=947166 RepID=A0A1D1V3Y9_RAMVA|nr:hypothetical protein RvY_07879 [Ramazzottius varieornatus]